MSAEKFPRHPILLVDDDEDQQRSFAVTLRNDGINNLEACCDSRQVADRLAQQEFDLVVLDLNMPGISGRELLPIITRRHPELPVVVVTGVDEVETAVKCMRNGAFDYLVKPVDEEALLAGIRRAIDVRDVKRENALLKERLLSSALAHPEAFTEIVTGNPAMQALFRYIEAIAVTPQPILITGETGVGKELVARATHRLSNRRGAFVPINIAGLDDNIFSDTLFGHLRGAFTGATDPRKGLIEQAGGGTLFLDEIGDLTPMSQVKLLRLLQEREYFPLGSDTAKRTDARIIVATNKDLKALQEADKFRDDLYYRLRSHHVHIPPLRDRLDDIPLLVDHFLDKAAKVLGTRKPAAPRQLLNLLTSYAFPGNVREIEAMVFNAVSTHVSGMLSMGTFRQTIAESPAATVPQEKRPVPGRSIFQQARPLPTVKEVQHLLIDEALQRTDGNQSMAADLLGITRQTLIRHLKMKKKS